MVIPLKLNNTFRWWPWLTLQIIAANVLLVVALGTAWYFVFMHQSSVYSERLMSTFNIEPGSLHAMYVDDVERQLWLSVTLALVVAVLASIGLAFLIAHPLRSLARATERLRYGDYRIRSKQEKGEVGRLAKNFNELAATLEQEEHRRAQFMADLGHELRTPIMSLRGYTEGLEDGIFVADEGYFKLMASELSHLTSLTHTIETMRLDSANMHGTTNEPGSAVGMLIDTAQRRWRGRFERRGLQLNLRIPDTLEESRLVASDRSFTQIVDNLLSNMLRYSANSVPCEIAVSRGQQKNAIVFTFSNEAPDITEEVLPFLFDRFYRVSESRTRVDDGRPSGLGLAVVKQLCIAHNGNVTASLVDEHLIIEITIPQLT